MLKERQRRMGMSDQRPNRRDDRRSDYERRRDDRYGNFGGQDSYDRYDPYDRYDEDDKGVEERSLRSRYLNDEDYSGNYARQNREGQADNYDYDRQRYYRGKYYKGGYDGGYKGGNQRQQEGDWRNVNQHNRQSGREQENDRRWYRNNDQQNSDYQGHWNNFNRNGRQNAYEENRDYDRDFSNYDTENRQRSNGRRRRSRLAFGANSQGQRNRDWYGDNRMNSYGASSGHGTADRRRRMTNEDGSYYEDSYPVYGGRRDADDYFAGTNSGNTSRLRNRAGFGSFSSRNRGAIPGSAKRRMGHLNTDWYNHN